MLSSLSEEDPSDEDDDSEEVPVGDVDGLLLFIFFIFVRFLGLISTGDRLDSSDVECFRFELFDFLVLDLPRSFGPHLRSVSFTITGVSFSSSAADFGPGVDFFDALAAYLFCPVIIEFCSTAVFC